MPKPFDATAKGMVEVAPPSWVMLSGYTGDKAAVIDADISTVTGASDKVIRVRGPSDWLLDINFQRGPDASVPRRTHLYSTLLEDRHELPVRSVVVLLTRSAYLSSINGRFVRGFAGEKPYDVFRYKVIRVWKLSPERLLQCGLGTLALAPISNVTEAELPGIIEQMKAKLGGAVAPAAAQDVWTAAYVLMGLRYQRDLVNKLLRGVVEMEESVTYQAIVEEGMAKGLARGKREEARKNLLLLGEKRFGPLPADGALALAVVEELEKLEQLLVRVLDVKSWEELLGLPSKRGGRRKKSS